MHICTYIHLSIYKELQTQNTKIYLTGIPMGNDMFMLRCILGVRWY